MLWVGVNFGELAFLVFLLLTITIGATKFAKSLISETAGFAISAMWLSYATLGMFFLWHLLDVFTVDEVLSRNVALVIESWSKA